VKFAAKARELYEKLLLAGKFHASFVVIGTLSSRMAGADGLNPQGIKHAKDVRKMFPLFWDGMILCGGDFDSFEVTIADAVYNDPALRKDLTTKGPCSKCAGTGIDKKKGTPCGECETTGMTPQKLHALFGMALSGLSYAEVILSSGTENDWYDKGKRGVFALVYGVDWNTLVQKLGVSETRAKAAYADFVKRYPGIGQARNKTFDAFCSMRQPAGIGSAVVWATPADYIETFLGFRRYFTLENKICKALFDLARNTPKHWRDIKLKVVRRDRVQTAAGAVASALYGSAFQMQAANMRAAANHEIQSPGAEITKSVQRRLWDLQPAGVHPLMLAPLNVHDELMVVANPSIVHDITANVREVVESFRDKVPLVGMTWFEGMENWAEKKGGAAPVKIRAKEMM
ncbi:MAG: DNA polymerase, partial [Thermoguttaceae bacterium]